MTALQQSKIYQSYIASLGWSLLEIEKNVMFVKKIPFLGTLAKYQRPDKLPEINSFVNLLKERKVKTLAIEPSPKINQDEFSRFCALLRPHVKLNSSPFLPTKTIQVDLKPSLNTIFHRFTEAKRRAVRKAEKNGIHIQESRAIYDFITVKNISAGFLGFITTHGARELWDAFAPNHASILLAISNISDNLSSPRKRGSRILNWIPGQARNDKGIVGGILLIFHKQTAYYWIAGATKEGKKLFAPTLLVYEAIKLSKEKGMKSFDFVGVWDERLPKENTQWKGFTKFKEGFGGKALYYPVSKL